MVRLCATWLGRPSMGRPVGVILIISFRRHLMAYWRAQHHASERSLCGIIGLSTQAIMTAQASRHEFLRCSAKTNQDRGGRIGRGSARPTMKA